MSLTVFIGLSHLRSEDALQIAAAHGKMPPNGDGADAQKRGDCRDGQPFEFVHDDDGAAARRQGVERTPDGGSRHQNGFLVVFDTGGAVQLSIVALPNSRLPPLIATDVDEHANEPGFLARQSEWNGRWRASGLEERLLHEVQRVVGVWSKAPGQAVQAFVMRVEEHGQPVRRIARQGDGEDTGHWHSVHISLNGRRPIYVGVSPDMIRNSTPDSSAPSSCER